MSAHTAILVLYGVACPDPCPVAARDLAVLERRAVELLAKKGFEVRPAAPELPRPTGSASTMERSDVADLIGADRVVALDLEHDGKKIWVTHFVRGVLGPWAVDKAECTTDDKGQYRCPSFDRVLIAGLRPRTALDVDVVSALRAKAGAVGKCVAKEDLVPAMERIYGRVEIDLLVQPSGRVKVRAIAPARVAKAELGACLKKAMEKIDVGPFEGKPIPFSVPVAL